MALRTRPTLFALAAALCLLTAPPVLSQTSETFKAAGPIPYATYLKRTGQTGPRPKRKAPARAAATSVKAAPTPLGSPPPPTSPALPIGGPQPRAAPQPIAAAPAAAPSPPVTAPKAPSAAPPPHGARLPQSPPNLQAPTPAGARLPASASLPPAELEAYVDGAVRQAMGEDGIAGAAVVVVQDGQVVLQKGYGLTHRSPARAVDPAQTLFRLGSVSKVLTWIEVLKQVDAGRYSLDTPIDELLPPRLKLGSEGFREPVRLRHLMAHTAGFEARELGRLLKTDPDKLIGLEEALRRQRSRRVREAGRLTSYSNYGVALAGAAAAANAHRSFDDLIESDLLQPAGLASTTFRALGSGEAGHSDAQRLADRLTDGFHATPGGPAQAPLEYGQDFGPALGASATPEDMGRLMQMLLGAAAPWSPRVAAALFTPLPNPVDQVPGWTAGLQQHPLPGGFTGFGQGGATLWSRSRLLLAPQLRLGVFVATNTDAGEALVQRLPSALVARFYAGPAAVVGPPSPPIDEARYAGLYLSTRRAYHGLEAMMARLTRAERVSVGEGGRLVVAEPGGSRTFMPAGRDRFVSPDGTQVIAFPSTEAGAPARVMTDAARAEGAVREGWAHDPRLLAAGAVVTAFVALLCLVGAVMRLLRDNRQTDAQAFAALVQNVTAVAWLFVIGAATFFLRSARDPAFAMTHWPNGWLVAASWTAVAAALLTVVQIVQIRDVMAETRRRDSWNAARRTRHIATVLVFVAFAVLVAIWGGLEPWSS